MEHDRKKYLFDASIKGENPVFEQRFNLELDPKEQNNLATNPEYLRVLKSQRERCQELVIGMAK